MKAIILAAGSWARLQPITLDKPKSMVEIAWKPILEYIIEDLYERVSEIVIVVKYKKEAVISYFGDEYKWVKISYIEQGDLKWTASALFWIEANEDVIIAYSDTIITKNDMNKIVNNEGNAILANRVENPEKYGIFKVDSEWNMLEVIEKPETYVWNLANFGFYKFDKEILELVKQVKVSKRGEYELTDAINMLCKKQKIKILALEDKFHDITYPEDIEKANNYILNQ